MQKNEMARPHPIALGLLTLGSALAAIGVSALLDSGFAAAGGGPEAATVRGVVRAVQHVTLSTDAALRAVEMPFREGDRFAKGDLLAAFDCNRQRAEYEAASAVLREADINLESNIQLDRHNAVGKNDLQISRARADRSRAELASLKTRIDECRFLAPFAGRIVEVGLRVHERTVPQRPYLSIIDDSSLEIEVIAPSNMLAFVQPGVKYAFKLDELGGVTVMAKVTSIAAVVDPVSKTVKLVGVIDDSTVGILPGMSGSATFRTQGGQ